MTRPANQFALLGQRRFAPFFWTQFLGAGNDNLFKFAFTMLVTYQLQVSWLPHALAGAVIGGLFVLPGALLVLALSMLYAAYGKIPVIEAVFYGIKAAVLAIVIEALLRAAP